jgi:guanosine-3',5'-bis(diphosphate) 3'-pyrophosphohydrolase
MSAISSLISEKTQQALQKVNRESLAVASLELWKIFEPRIQHYKAEEREFIELAFYMMVDRHGEQRRKSGEFYIVHPVSAALILLDLKPDKETLAAMLLHDVPEDTYEKPEEGIKAIEHNFNNETACLVAGITKLGKIKYRGEQRYAENLRKLFVAMSTDLRVVFIKLSDRIHNLSTLKHLREDKAKRIALESLEIYAPIAERMGMSHFRGIIEELSFPFAYPKDYKDLKHKVDALVSQRDKKAKQLVKITQQILSNKDIPYSSVFGRAKKYFSLYRKLQEKGSMDKVYDIIAVRVVTSSIAHCYQIMAELHNHFEVLDDRTKDYIKHPKPNGYRSIHLTVRDKDSDLVYEYQIRTNKMHQYAEYGLAAHWSYKENQDQVTEKLLDQEGMQWVRDLIELDPKKMREEEYVKHVKLNVFPDRIFALTPDNDVIDLPQGSTPLDFAFKIHEFIGSHATGARINGKMSKLNTRLQSGDVVEILTAKKQHPTAEWLNWIQTPSAAKHLRSILRKIGIPLPAIKEQKEK